MAPAAPQPGDGAGTTVSPHEAQTQHGPIVHDDATVTFRVWAPRADRVDVIVDGQAQAMMGREYGWWALRTDAGHGSRYGFALDGRDPLPDPASRHQPDGVHGLSAVVDPCRFAWSEREPQWRAAPLWRGVLYELHVGTFTEVGTLDAVTDHLPGLAALGVTHVEIMPVAAFNGSTGWGYDGVDWYAVHEPYGGPMAFARLVDACHVHGLAVVLDVVYNHLGPSGNYLTEFGPYLTDRHSTPWGDALNLDGPGSDPVRALMLDNICWWLETMHVDALRLDAVHGLVDTSAIHILSDFAATADAAAVRRGRPLTLIAESDRCDPQTVRPREVGGMALDGQWADGLHHAIHVALTGEQAGYYSDYRGLSEIGELYRRGFLYDGRFSPYRERTVGAPLPPDVPGWRLVSFLQNHDQVGNRARGERITALVEPDLVRVGAVLLCAAPHTPMLFMGDEYGETRPFQYFTSHPEPELASAVREGRREEFAAFADFADGGIPDPQDPGTVLASTLDRSAADSSTGRARRALWQDLLALRRAEPAIGNGRRDLVEVVEAGDDWLVLLRGDPASRTMVLAINLANQSQARLVPLEAPEPVLLLSSDAARYGGRNRAATMSPAGGATTIALPPRSACVWALNPPS